MLKQQPLLCVYIKILFKNTYVCFLDDETNVNADVDDVEHEESYIVFCLSMFESKFFFFISNDNLFYNKSYH